MTTVPKIEDCNPGFRPLEYYVVIAPADVEEKVGSIILVSKEEDKVAVQRGRIVAVSPLAFNFADGSHHAAVPGDVVLFGRYAGTLQKGADGKDYRLVRDRDVIAVMEEAPAKVEWQDPDDAPKLDERWFKGADHFLGDVLVRKGDPDA